MTREAEQLGRAVRWRVMSVYFGQLLLVVGALLVPPIIVALVAQEWRFALGCAGGVAVVLPLARLCSRVPSTEQLQVNEGMVLVASAFVLAPAVMAVPMLASGLPLEEVLFECVSGVTTTGLSTMTNLEGRSVAFLFTRSWLQWFGGLGIAAFAVIFLTRPGPAALRLFDEPSSDLLGGARQRGAQVLRVYGGLTLVNFLALAALGASFPAALAIAMASVSTGGFAPFDASLNGFDGVTLSLVTLFFCLLGAVLHSLCRVHDRKGLRQLAGDLELRMLLVASVVATLGLGLTLHFASGLPWSRASLEGLVLALSAQTTTGFNRIEPADIDATSKVITMVAMFTGGGLGSTAGGVKLMRVAIFFSAVRTWVVKTCLPPHAVLAPRIAHEEVEAREVIEALMLIVLFLVVIVASWIPFVVAGYDPLDALFDVVSAVGTVGLSTGVVSESLPLHLKAILCVDMWLGRLEIVAWLVLFYPRTWVGRRVAP